MNVSYGDKNPEFDKMVEDIKKYGNEQKGEYKGVKWSAKRPYGTYWCAYVVTGIDLSEEQVETLDGLAHCGLTSGLGFDCAHYNDYSYNPVIEFNGNYPHIPITDFINNDERVYRSFEYVTEKLFGMIDFIVTLSD